MYLKASVGNLLYIYLKLILSYLLRFSLHPDSNQSIIALTKKIKSGICVWGGAVEGGLVFFALDTSKIWFLQIAHPSIKDVYVKYNSYWFSIICKKWRCNVDHSNSVHSNRAHLAH